MFTKTKTSQSTGNYWEEIKNLSYQIDHADAILIGAGAGLSVSAGLNYDGKRFFDHFPDFAAAYGLQDMYSAGFYPYDTLEEYWAYWSRHIYLNRYLPEPKEVYQELRNLVQDKNYFILTTNVDHCFQKAGFDQNRLFYTQGDYGLWQCSKACHQKTYDNEAQVKEMVLKQRNRKIPSSLIPYCPKCGAPMTMNLRMDDTFVQDEGWYAASDRYDRFLSQYKNKHLLLLELGVGNNTPGIIKYNFWQMVYQNPNAVYACINQGQAYAPSEIRDRSICIDGDIGNIVKQL